MEACASTSTHPCYALASQGVAERGERDRVAFQSPVLALIQAAITVLVEPDQPEVMLYTEPGE